MSAKTHFLKKLQAQQAASRDAGSKTQADIAAFRQQMGQLHTQITDWLAGTGVVPDSTIVTLTDLLVDSGAFEIPGIVLRYEKRAITLTPLFLYGHGVTGCVAVSLCVAGQVTPLSRLFMRSGRFADWSCTPVGFASGERQPFDEERFFHLIDSLLP